MTGRSPIRFLLNDSEVETDLPPGLPALEFLRRHRRLRGTKEGCGEGECGACTVLVGRLESGVLRYRTAASCLLPIGQLEGSHVLTVEGLGPGLTPIQEALCAHNAVQCGFCTPGMVMALTGFFCSSATLSEEDAADALDGNICRCTGYVPIRAAAAALSERYRERLGPRRDRCTQLAQWGILPPSAARAAERLAAAERSAGPGASVQGVLVGGATDLLVQQPQLAQAPALRFAFDVSGARGIRTQGERLVIGAATTIEELRESSDLASWSPQLSRSLSNDLKLFASTPLRNRATIAGNLVNASPIGDLSVMLLALDATLRVAHQAGATGAISGGGPAREIPLRTFFKAYRQVDLADGDVIQAIVLPLAAVRFHFEKVSRRRVLDIASVNSACCVRGSAVSMSAGGVAPVPLYLEAASRALSQGPVDTAAAADAVALALAQIQPISDVRGSADYKRLALRSQIIGALAALFPDSVEPAALLEARV